MPNVHQLLLRYNHLSKDEKALNAAIVTLDKMADGGIYDHVGGGFARYSTDRFWKVPHFEKMLYDNSQLVSLYAEAYQLTHKSRYKEVVYESLEFIEREMTSTEGGFYSSLDADSEGEEGKFYVWSEEELKDVLGEDAEIFNEYFTVKTSGNWEGENILHITKSPTIIAEKQGIAEDELEDLIKRSKPKLLKKRAERIRPGLDDKVLTSWNALMLKGYVDAYRVFGEERFLKTALKNAQFLKTNMLRKDGGLNRIYKDGKSSVNGFSDDYSFLIEAYVALYQATFDESWLFEANELMEYTLTHFFEKESRMFFYSSDEDDPLITRSKEVADNVIPGSNSSLAKGLFLLGTYLYKDDYLKKSEQMLNNVSKNIAEQGPYHSNWGILMTYFSHLPYEIAIVGPDHEKFRKEFDQEFLPHAFFLGGDSEGKLELLENKLVKGATYIYVCQNKSCKLPVQSVAEALELMK
ncbi:UNVERIFIED_CONTAM: hypothetical protein GTU68_010398 [Idotea baltica]|nr:hypothetical protein [Idotea baltica]